MVENPDLLAMVVFVVIVVQNILQGSAKLLARSVMDVANQTILYPCVDLGIGLNLKTKEIFHTVPINLVVLSRINRTDHIMTSMRSITKITLIHDYEQDSVTMVFNTQFRNKNVMFDEISSQPSLQHALTDLHVSDSGSKSKTFHFKVDTGACSNLLPYNLYKQIAGHKAKMNFLHNTIDRTVNLVAYNNKRIKQLGTCTLCVSCGAITRMVKFFIVDSRLNPIIGLDDSHKLQLINFNCPIHQSWTGQKCTNLNGFDSVSDNSPHSTAAGILHGAIPSILTKDWIVYHPRYKHLFKGIGKFNMPPC